MADFLTAAITFVLSNFPLTFLVIGLIVSLIAIARSLAPLNAATIVEKQSNNNLEHGRSP